MGKELVAFALVAEEYEKTGDPIRGLKPLFAPLLLPNKGRPFDADNFADQFTDAYGLQMTPFIARALSERMSDLGLLTRVYDKCVGESYHVADFEWAAEPIAEKQVAKTIDLFVDWATDRASEYRRSFERDSLEDAILVRLARPEFASIFVLQAEDKNTRIRKLMGVGGADVNAKEEAFLDYLVAAFVLHVEANAPSVFNAISQISYGSLIADAVAGLAVPVRKEDGEKKLRLILDAPILLDLLDLNTPAHREYAEGLLRISTEAGLLLATFDHCLEEMRYTIQATLEASARGEGYGPMAHRLRTESGLRLKATVIRDHLRERVADLGVTVMRAEMYRESRYAKWFPEEKVDQVRNAIGDLHENLEARIKDAESVAAVARLKGERGDAESLFDAGTIFITRNSVLVKKVNKFLSRGRSGPRPTFTIATDGQIVGVLWFVGGMRGMELSRRRLISSCSAAVLPKRELIARIASMLEDIEPDLRAEFETLMADKRASLCVMRLTAGDLDLIDRDRSLQVVEEMRRQLSAPAVERAEAAEAKAAAAESAAAELRRVAQEDVQTAKIHAEEQVKVEAARSERLDLEMAQVRLELEHLRSERDASAIAARDVRHRILARIAAAEDASAKRRRSFARRVRTLLLILAVVIILAAVSRDAPLWIRVLVSLISIVSMGAIANYASDLLERFAHFYFREDAILIEDLRKGLE
jgi:hypothetical protein